MSTIGLSDAAKNFIKMTKLVAKGNSKLERKGSNPVELQTTLQQYFKERIK